MFKTPEEMQAKIDEYFEWCDNRAIKKVDDSGKEFMIGIPAPYTMSGLARRLGMDRKGLINYKNRDEFFPAIHAARERVHEDVENRLMETRNERGAIFNLKNNFGWKDESQTDVTSGGKPLPLLGGVAVNGISSNDGDPQA